jgi:MFS family permease
MFSVTSFFVSPILGKMISKIGRKNSILIGFAFIILPTLGLAQLVYVDRQ